MPGSIRHDASRGLPLAALLGAALSLGAACSAPASSNREPLGTNSAAGSTAFPNDQTAYDYFRAKGFTSVQAAGIVGNLDQESGVDPTISQQGGGPGRGIAQWSAGGRWDSDPGDNLVAFASQAGQSPTSLGVQLDFILFELQTFPDYGLAKLKATTTVADAATEFELDFEGCGIPAQCDAAARISYAQAVLDAYGNDPVASDAGAAPDDASTVSEAGEADAATVDPGASDAAPHGGGDAGAPVGAGAGTKSDAGAAAAAPNGADGSGCAIATMGHGQARAGAWLAALGIALAITRLRAARRRG